MLRLALAAVAGLALFWLYAVGVVLGFWPPAWRPAGVPRSAHFVTMVEQQTWFDCVADMARNIDHCRAWDGRGEPIADGDYQLLGENRAATAEELRPAWVVSALTKDGRQISYAILQFEYDHRNSSSRPLVLAGFQDCLKAGWSGRDVVHFSGCEERLR
jgi:hypothetical protein